MDKIRSCSNVTIVWRGIQLKGQENTIVTITRPRPTNLLWTATVDSDGAPLSAGAVTAETVPLCRCERLRADPPVCCSAWSAIEVLEGHSTRHTRATRDRGQSTSLDTTSPDTTSLDTTPLDTTSLDTTPLDTTSLDTTPLDTTPLDITRLDTSNTTTLDTTSLDSTPLDTPHRTVTHLTTPPTGKYPIQIYYI